MTVAEYIAQFLKENHTDYVFGFQGSAMLKMAVELKSADVKYVQGFFEQASAFEADAYSRITGDVAVCMATSGPGAMNLMGGIADAYFDGVPLLALTGQYNSDFVFNCGDARQNGFQDMDIVSIARPVTKYAKMLMAPEDIAYELEQAWYQMTNGRPGPALLDIPTDFQFAQIDPDALKHFEEPEEEEAGTELLQQALDVYDLLANARRPLILAGGGIRQAGAADAFREFADITGIPVIASLQGLDCYDDIYGLAGLYGSTHANLAAKQADVLLVLGSRLGVRHAGKHIEDYTSAKIIHVDADPTELNRVTEEYISVQADLLDFLEELNCIASDEEEDSLIDKNARWITKLQEQKKELEARVYVSPDPDPVKVAEELMAEVGDFIATEDVGMNQVWVSQAFHGNGSSRLLNSGGYGSMGFSLPAAIGAAYADPDRPVLAFTGDGGFHMNQQELLFLQLHPVNVNVIVYNNSVLGLMKETQDRYYGAYHIGNTPEEFTCVNLEKLAAVYDIPFVRITSEADLAAASKKIAKDGPSLIEVVLKEDAHCINSYDEMEAIKEKYLK